MTSGDDLTSEDVLQKVENFLDDIENQKKKDEEQFELLRAGAIDDIFAEFMNADNTNSGPYFVFQSSFLVSWVM